APEGVPPDPAPRSYAQAAKKTPATLTPKVGSAGRSQPASAPIPVRIIARPPSMDGRAPAAYFSPLLEKGPTEPYRRLSHALALSPVMKKVTLLGVHQNRKGNLIVTLAPGTSDADVTRVYPVIKNVLAIGGAPPVLQRDIPWSKLLVSNVLVRADQDSPTAPEVDILASLLQNSLVSKLKLTLGARWVRNPASITGARSSFTFAFEDRDGSITKSLLKTPLFVFGNPVRAKKWVDRRPRRGPM
ncbi:hypothetical protein FRC06_009889, partial [Ceratobasidium sp. 370]